MKVCLDTNLYIEAERDAEFNASLQRFFRGYSPFVYVHRTVIAELAVGSATMSTRNVILARYQGAAESVGHLITPTGEDWDAVSEIVVQLRSVGRLTTIAQNFMNDCLIAAGCARLGVRLVTRNTRDFERIRRVLPGLETRSTLPDL